MHSVMYAESHKLVFYAECHYAECLSAECRGARKTSYNKLTIGIRIDVLLHSGQFSKSFENLWKKVAWEFFFFFFARIEMFLQ
jgi:hypothetical protein